MRNSMINGVKEIDKHIQKTGFNVVEKNYNTVAIIGPQSSGKSTLLNKMFDTNFDVMSSSVGRGQTTKGVWAACHLETKVLVLDCEGTDSKERGEDRHKFEHTSSLFCLAMADLLIVNMWTNEVGLYTASNYGVLKIVFEMNLKLFQQECSKRILIVLRDFDAKRNEKTKFENLILSDIMNIWKEIKKPEKYQDSSPRDFFEFEFIPLPHKKYQPKEFDAETNELRKRLNEDHPQYFFNHVSKEKNVPADGLKHYIAQLWSDIINEKELNIPSQKEMLSNYRCNEIKDSILSEYENSIREIVNLAAKQYVDNYKEVCLDIFNKIMNDYDKPASNYVDKIYKNVRKQLESYLSQKFLMGFSNQAKRIIPISQKFMRQDLQKEIKNNGDNFFLISQNIKKKYLKNLLSKLNDKKVFEYWNVNEQEYSEIFDEIIESQRRICLEDLKNHTIKAIEKQLEETLLSRIENFSQTFWADFNSEYISFLAMKMFPLKNYLRDFYKMSNEDIDEFANYVESEIYSNLKKDIIRKTKEISSIAVDLFKKKFWYEGENIQRNWNKLDDEDIDFLFKKFRGEYSDIFETFKIFRLVKNPLRYLKYSSTEIEEYQEVLKMVLDNLSQIMEKESEQFENLMRQNEISSMKRKFEDGITHILEDAKRRKGGIFQNNLPWWGWALIIFFGLDDFLRWAKTIWIIPMLMLVGGYYVLHHFNLTHLVRNFYYDIEEKIILIKRKIIR